MQDEVRAALPQELLEHARLADEGLRIDVRFKVSRAESREELRVGLERRQRHRGDDRRVGTAIEPGVDVGVVEPQRVGVDEVHLEAGRAERRRHERQVERRQDERLGAVEAEPAGHAAADGALPERRRVDDRDAIHAASSVARAVSGPPAAASEIARVSHA